MQQKSFSEISQKRDPLTSYINQITSYYDRGISTIQNDVRNARLFNTELTEITTNPVSSLNFTDILNGLIEIDGTTTSILLADGNSYSDTELQLLQDKLGNVSVGTGIYTYFRNKTGSLVTISGTSNYFIGTNSIELEENGTGKKYTGILFTKVTSLDPFEVKYTLSGPFLP